MDTLNQQSSPQSAPEQTPAPPKPALNSRTFLLALILFISIMISLTTYLLAGRTIPISKPPPSISPTTSQPFPTPDLTANWKTYAHTKYGFEIEYPGDWQIQSRNNNSFWLTNIKIDKQYKDASKKIATEGFAFNNGLFIDIYESDETLEDFIQSIYNNPDSPHGNSIKSIKNIGFPNGMQAIFVESNTGGYGLGSATLLNSKNYVFRFTKYYGGAFGLEKYTDQQFDQILATFKFTDQNQSPSPTPYFPNNPQIEEEGKLKVQNTPEVKTLIGKYGKSNVSIKALDVKLVKDIQFIMQLDPRFKEQTGCIIVVEVNNTGYVYQLDKDNEILYRQTLEEFKQKTANVDQLILEKFYSSLK